MSDFLHMGGFGSYIWSAMGIAAFLMLAEPFALIIRRRSVLAEIKRHKRFEQRRSSKRQNKQS